MKNYFIAYLFFCFGCLNSQTINNSVLNSAGQTATINSNFIYTDNIGEPFIETVGSNSITITQGFLQPEKVGPSLFVIWNHVTCSDKNDGSISTSLANIMPTQTVSYIWTPSSACPQGNCSAIYSLSAGTYSIKVIVKNPSGDSLILTKPPITIEDVNGPCVIKIHNGITSNGDGINDIFTIDNIEEFPNNRVSIFNRYGILQKEILGYNNKDKAWPTNNNNLPPTTYFYVIELGNGSKAIKGWLEILKN